MNTLFISELSGTRWRRTLVIGWLLLALSSPGLAGERKADSGDALAEAPPLLEMVERKVAAALGIEISPAAIERYYTTNYPHLIGRAAFEQFQAEMQTLLQIVEQVRTGVDSDSLKERHAPAWSEAQWRQTIQMANADGFAEQLRFRAAMSYDDWKQEVLSSLADTYVDLRAPEAYCARSEVADRIAAELGGRIVTSGEREHLCDKLTRAWIVDLVRAEFPTASQEWIDTLPLVYRGAVETAPERR